MSEATSKYHVLIVDDEPGNLQLLSALLYQKDVNVLLAQSGPEALAIVAQRLPDLVLLDILMPEMDGFAVCAQLKQSPATAALPVIFLTAKAEQADIVRGFQAGAVDYIVKPLHPEETLSRIFTHLELKRARDQLTAQHRQLAAQHQELQARAAVKEQQLINTLRERVTELDCLYGIARLVEIPGITLPAILQGTVELIPPALKYPDSACARIVLAEQTFRTPNFQETPWKQASPILVHAQPAGSVVVCYLEEKPLRTEGPFQPEERRLLDAVAERVGRIIERQRAEEALCSSEQQYRVLIENVADGIGIIQDNTLVFVNDTLTAMLGMLPAELIGKAPADFFQQDYARVLEDMPSSPEQQRTEPPAWPILRCIVTGDNRELWMEGQHSIITWEGRPAILMNVRDVTRSKQKEIAMSAEREHLWQENLKLRSAVKDPYKFEAMIGRSQAMRNIYDAVVQAAASEANVVIYGESGAGKELIARTIHQLSQRQNKAFIPVNCGAIPETLFEREFFGHRKGAFTGAERDEPGFFDAAHEGTLFLDEVGELSPLMQAKLLRAIDGRGYTPVGSQVAKHADARIIAATNRDLKTLVRSKLMREDFFYRIHVLTVTAPALRQRQEDIPLLVDHFLRQEGRELTWAVLPRRIREALYTYDWPGNVRELRNQVQHYLSTGQIKFSHLHAAEADLNAGSRAVTPRAAGPTLQASREHSEKQAIIAALDQYRGHRGKTAEHLGITRRSLHRKMQKYGLRPPYRSAT